MTVAELPASPHPRPTRVLLVDDHPLVREGVAAVLKNRAGLLLVGVAGTIAAALQAVERLHPHVVLLDHHLPDGEGVAACPNLLAADPSLRIVIVTMFPSPDLARCALSAGARGFLVKGVSPDELVEAIGAVMKGARFTDPAARGTGYGLSLPELRVLALLAEGQTNARIAGRLGLSAHTVKTHVGRVMAKLGAANRAEAASIGVTAGLVRRRN